MDILILMANFIICQNVVSYARTPSNTPAILLRKILILLYFTKILIYFFLRCKHVIVVFKSLIVANLMTKSPLLF